MNGLSYLPVCLALIAIEKKSFGEMEKRGKNVTGSYENMKRSVRMSSDVVKHHSSLSVPGEGGLRCPVTRNMRHLLDEFKGLYEERLRRLPFETGGGSHEEMLRMKVRILNSYVNDLSDQTQVLVQTVEDLEDEASGKVAILEAKICSSDQIIDDLDHQKRRLEENWENLRRENVDMKLDVSALAGLVQHAQRTHKLDVSGVTLRTVVLEKISEPSAYNRHIPKPEDFLKAHVDDLRSQLKTKDRIIQNLREEMKRSSLERRPETSEPSDGRDTVRLLQIQIESLQRLELQKVTQLTERDIAIAKLQTELRIARQDERDVHKEVSEQREKVNEVQGALRELQDQTAAKDVQRGALLETSKDLEEKAASLTVELQKSRERSQKQQMELLSLKQKKDALHTEMQMQEQRTAKVERAQRQKEAEATRLASLIEQLQVQLQESRDSHTQASCQLGASARELEGVRAELAEARRQRDASQAELSRLEKVVEEQAEELKDLHLQHRVWAEESGRLRARLQAQTVCAQSQQDVLTSEISSTEERELKQGQLAEQEVLSKMNEREDRVRAMQLEMTSLRAAHESLKRTVTVKERFNGELSQECTGLRQTQGCLQNQLQVCEEKVNSLDLEVGLLKSKLQEKTEQSQQLQDEIVKQQEALSRANETLKDTRRAAGNKICKKEHKLAVIQKELIEVQTKYSECQNESLRRENVAQQLEEEAGRLTAQIKEQSQDITKLKSERNQLQLQLTVVMEKHRTAQQEVSSRDQVILQLKTELKTREEECRGAQEELGLQEQEVNRLNERVKSLQAEVRELWERGQDGEQRLDRGEEDKRNLQLQLNITQQQMKHQMKTVEQLGSELDSTKQAHTTDMERWNQKALILQNQLDRACLDLQDSQSRLQEQRLKTRELEWMAKQHEAAHLEALAKIQDGAELVNRLTAEMLLLKQRVEDVQTELTDSRTAAKKHEVTSDIFRQKYQTAMEKAQQLEGQIQSLEEEVRYANKQVLEAQEAASGLRAEILTLERRYEERCKQTENSEEAIDQLTDELQAAQDGLKSSGDRLLEYEGLIERLKQEVDVQHKEILDHESMFLQLQAELTSYQFSHSYSSKEYEAQQKHVHLLQKELGSVTERLGVERARSEEEARGALELKASLQRRTLETQGLENALRALRTDADAAQQGHSAAIAQLEQEVTRLETELADARTTGAHRDQAIRKRDGLLKTCEADLLQAREAVRDATQRLELCERAADGLRADVLSAETLRGQAQQESAALRAQVTELSQELQDVRQQHRDTAQALAGLQEQALLQESSLGAVQEQLREREAELVRQEQSARTAHTQLRSSAQRTHTANDQANQLRLMVERLQGDAAMLKEALQRSQLEEASQREERLRAEVEHSGAKEEVLALTQQLQQQEDTLRCLREELGQEHTRTQEQQRQLGTLRMYVENMETELEHLRIKESSDASMVRRYESSVTKQKAELQESKDSLAVCGRNLVKAEEAVACLQQERTSLEDSRRQVEDEAESLRRERSSLREKLEAATAELETRRLTAEEARADNARLHQESQLAVASVNRWIKEQKIASENLAVKITEQTKLLTLVTTEKDHLQETKDALELEIRTLRVVIDEKQKEIGHLKAIHSHSANQQAMLNHLRGRLEVEEIERESLMARNICAIEDMHTRLKANMESITLLNEQLGALSEENAKQRKLLEIERALRRQLAPRPPLEPGHGDGLHLSQLATEAPRSSGAAAPDRPCPPRSPGTGRTEPSPRGGGLAEDPALGKDPRGKWYWVQRVGELSAQLQESTEYWSERMGDLTVEIERAQAASPRK
ncbi:hypothetical protein AAFF_G00094670 [Aldrovandia affinis]|uniref:Uncharacterized protein n=1 Tax=Aldrovandia affinis TaxID=143900 RepID=A0AAD7WXQ0_9TELE|nr:hypothetical protein AAFF_G00094670 [Aldrovandia affinis]